MNSNKASSAGLHSIEGETPARPIAEAPLPRYPAAIFMEGSSRARRANAIASIRSAMRA
jgi:hypothetical protein